MVRIARHASSENDLRTTADQTLSMKNVFRSTRAKRNVKHSENAPLGNIPNVHKWIEEHITVQKRPFGTFSLAGAFSHSSIGLVIFEIPKCTKQGAKPATRKQQKPPVEKDLSDGNNIEKELYDSYCLVQLVNRYGESIVAASRLRIQRNKKERRACAIS